MARGSQNGSPPTALALLMRANTLQAWRRLKGIRQQSALLTFVIALFMTGYLALAFWLFLRGLSFVAKFPGLGTLLIERLLYLLFAFLFLLLMLSNLVISYTNFFRNRESAALLTLPVTAQTIFRWKLIESSLVASWAFLFLIAPFLAAYGMTRHLPWHFYPFTVFLVGLFIVLPSVIGCFLSTVVARYMDRRVFQIGGLLAMLVIVGLVAVWLRPERGLDENTETRVLVLMDKMLTRTRIAQFPLLPSYWLSSSVLQWAEGAFSAAVFFAAVLLSNVLFFGSLAFNLTGGFFYNAASAVQSRSSVFRRWRWFQAWQRKQQQAEGLPGRLERLVASFPRLSDDVRALMVKDGRMFWRDTTQWAQSLMLFGLLAVYIVNLRHFSQQLSQPFWINLVAFLNLGACSLNLATITTRFVYPMFSLEGRRIWILGLSPVGLKRVILQKFWMSFIVSSAITVMTFTLNGLAMGLGVLYPNLKEENPSKIVSGFGGTFCLVLSFLYILASVVLLALGAPWAQTNTGEGIIRSVMCLSGFGVLSFALGWMPLQFALQRVKTFEV